MAVFKSPIGIPQELNTVVLVKPSVENSLQFQKPSTRVRKNLTSRACPLGKQLSHLPFGKVSFKSYLTNKKIYLSRKYRTGMFLSPVYNVYPLVRAYMPTPLFNRVSSSYLFIYRYLHKFWKLYIKFINIGIN